MGNNFILYVRFSDSELVVIDVSSSSSTNVINLEKKRGMEKRVMFRRGIRVKNNTFDEAEKQMRQIMSNGFDAPLKLPF
uniref:Uncharacterized protein n=1 Tax=Tanacetum cinerariifolium TaxID=118510 RepID=A0A6L2KXF7_TANCI|nr:hypothetical protein [Tanacetum cinerariifolium]